MALDSNNNTQLTSNLPSISQIGDAIVYFKCCELAYANTDEATAADSDAARHGLRLIHRWADQPDEVQYTVFTRTCQGSDKVQDIIFSFRGLLDSFDAADVIPFRKPSVTSLNRRAMLANSALVQPGEEFSAWGRCHAGIGNYFQRLKDELLDYFRASISEFRSFFHGQSPLSIIFTGFSMGAVLSAMSAMLIKEEISSNSLKDANISLINFASPKIGDSIFAEAALKAFETYDNWYLKSDPVPSFPENTDYVHGGNMIVLIPNKKGLQTRDCRIPAYSIKYFAHDGFPAPNERLVTNEHMKLGIESAALPCFSVLLSCSKYHRMTPLSAALLSGPVADAFLYLPPPEDEVDDQKGSNGFRIFEFCDCRRQGDDRLRITAAPSQKEDICVR